MTALTILAWIFGPSLVIGIVWGLLARGAKQDPYRHLGLVESHRVARRDTGQEYER